MKRILIYSIAFLLHLTLPLIGSAQYYFLNDRFYEGNWIVEAGTTLGGMNALTDLGENKGLGQFYKQTNLSGVFYFTGMYRSLIGIRLEGCLGSVEEADSIQNNKSAANLQNTRNLSFQSKINDIQVGVEFHPLFLPSLLNNREYPPMLSPYILAGVGFFSFDPKANYNGQWYSLQPLRTEGQGLPGYRDRKPYALQQRNYHLGAGIRAEVTNLLVVRMELDYRMLNTDYLDDVSQTYVDPALFFQNLPAG
ncbi:MAG: hypothetical protein FJX92_07960 [Bacteroidetes bacterium]|nr:hypothetical protein [Bacteroidota bacterium]